MIDWMIEVTTTFELSIRTFFVGAKIMDKFFALQECNVHPNLLHIIGIVCMFVASKVEDVDALRMSHAREKIGHSKFTLREIASTEGAVLRKLGFLVNFVVKCDFIEEIASEFGISSEVSQLALFYSRLSMYYYSHLSYKESQVAYCSLMLAAQTLHKEEIIGKLVEKAAKEKVTLTFEEFKTDIAGFKDSFPRLESVFHAHRMTFNVVQGTFLISPYN
jgi:hypothetical protein